MSNQILVGAINGLIKSIQNNDFLNQRSDAPVDDSIDGIFNSAKECAQISKWSGGIGLHIHNIRPAGSHIRGTNVDNTK